MTLYILRGAFVLLVTSVATLYVLSYQTQEEVDRFGPIAAMLGMAVAVAAAVIALDAITRHKKLSSLSGIFLGLIAGLVAAYALSFVVDLVSLLWLPEIGEQQRQAYLNLFEGVKVVMGLITCYLGISLVLQTKDDFRFVIPYVEFSREVRGNRPTLVDTSVLVDGRIVDVLETKVLQGTLIVPRFVLEELQTIADSSDKLKRSRGRRGLDVLKQLQDSETAQVRVEEHDAQGGGVDQKLLALGQQIQARVMTNDYNLNKVAAVRGVDVVNLNDLAKSLRPVVLPGEPLETKIVKPGESYSQGVGYLEDGTMVVIEGGREHIGKRASVTVTSTLQTSAGRMIFGKYDGQVGADSTKPDGPGQKPSHEAESSPGDRTPDQTQSGERGGSSQPEQGHPRPSETRRSAQSSSTQTYSSRSSGRNPRRG